MTAPSVSITERICRFLPIILAYRVSSFLLRREARTPGEKFIARTLTGSRYTYETGDLVADSVRMCGFWDWRVIAVAKAVAGRGGSIIEIGANTGTETVGFADVVGRGGHVVAIEPGPDNLWALKNNVELNGFAHVDVRPWAVGNRGGYVHFSPGPDGNSGMGHIESTKGVEDDADEVEMVTLDSVQSTVLGAALVVIDVEGAELEVLEGAHGYIMEYRPVLYIEACGETLARFGSTLSDLDASLGRLGLKVYEVNRWGIAPVDIRAITDEMSYIKNWLAIPVEETHLTTKVRRTLVLGAISPRLGQRHLILR